VKQSNKNKLYDRRHFLEFMGQTSVVLSGLPISSALGVLTSACSTTSQSDQSKRPESGGIAALNPSQKDELQLTEGLSYYVLASWGDSINAKNESFGFNNDYVAWFPFPDNLKNPGFEEMLLCVNHEAPDPQFVSGYEDSSKSKSKAQVEMEMDSVGVSVLHVRRKLGEKAKWEVVKNSKHNRRISGRTEIPIVAPRDIEGSRLALGTIANCAGGVTPWGTYLTCEENYDSFYGEVLFKGQKRININKESLNWYNHFPQPPEHYGWVVEIDPWTGAAKKLTGLGRFAHECATTTTAKDGRIVVYTGDDANDQCLYKFISEKPGSLETGKLYVADTLKGKWILLDWKTTPGFKKKFRDQTEVLIRTREAAKMAGGTPLDRPEDIEICPRTKAIYMTLTNNLNRGNYFGSIMKLEEKNQDPLSMEFQSSNFLAGGAEVGFACPDNLAFDAKGDLWMTTDISGEKMNKGEYAPFKNNGLFYIPMSGPSAGRAHLVATAPVDSELTGPAFSPDGKTLFLCVQHPGELSKGTKALTSNWPNGGKEIPRPSLVCIEGDWFNHLKS